VNNLEKILNQDGINFPGTLENSFAYDIFMAGQQATE